MKGKYNTGVHSALLAAVGAYILYIAWILLEKYRRNAGEMPPALNIIAIVVLGLGGLGTLYYAWHIFLLGKMQETVNEDEKEAENNDGNN